MNSLSRKSSNESQKSPKPASIEMINFAEYWDFHNKFRGCLMGSLLGDCIGTLFERDYSVSLSNLRDLYSTLTQPQPSFPTSPPEYSKTEENLAPLPKQKMPSKTGIMGRDRMRSSSSISIPENDILQPLEMSLAEKCKRKPLSKKFSMTDDRNRPLERFSDDTVMIRSVLISLIRNKGLDPKDMSMQLSEDYFQNLNRKFGVYLRDIFLQLRENRYQDPFGPAKSVKGKNGAFGNGSATRVSPLAIFEWNSPPISLIESTKRFSRLTHCTKEAVHGACLQALAINLALKWDHMMESKEITQVSPRIDESTFQSLCREGSRFFDAKLYIAKLSKKMNDIESGRYSLMGSLKNLFKDSFQQSSGGSGGEGTYTEKLEVIQEFLGRKELPSRAEVVGKLGNGMQALNSIPLSLYCFVITATYKILPDFPIEIENPVLRCLFYTISFGGNDCDSISSMASAISGAFWGYNNIPTDIIESCENYDNMLKLADELYNICFSTEGQGSTIGQRLLVPNKMEIEKKSFEYNGLSHIQFNRIN